MAMPHIQVEQMVLITHLVRNSLTTINSKKVTFMIYTLIWKYQIGMKNPHTLNFTTNGIMDDVNSQIILKDNGIEDVFSVYTLDV